MSEQRGRVNVASSHRSKQCYPNDRDLRFRFYNNRGVLGLHLHRRCERSCEVSAIRIILPARLHKGMFTRALVIAQPPFGVLFLKRSAAGRLFGLLRLVGFRLSGDTLRTICRRDGVRMSLLVCHK